MRNKFIVTTFFALLVSLIVGSSFVGAASKEVTVLINGVKVYGDGTYIQSGKTYTDAIGYADLLGMEYSFSKDTKKFSVNGQTLNAKIHNNRPAVHIREIAAATGGDNITWDQATLEAYVLDLPEGAIDLEGTGNFMAPGVPGMGQHWGLPNELPLGPIYGVEKGKLVFIEQMVSQEDFINGVNHINIPGMKGLPSPPIVHTDIEFLEAGHPGFEVPHFDIHHYFVTHDEHLKFSMPPEGATPGHQH
ncbi:hypothetical protein ACJ2A9_17915 [Anaerobacillus sp. MEB173]|uniref:hypothetical protein n=1 Tax=Anaerobacillus sp. MEB173 TaxID=3383345 RepID=UPI003F906CE0